MTPELFLQLLLAIAAGAGVYAAIKADLTRAIITAERAEKDAESAHKRMDIHIETQHDRRGA